VTHDQNAYLEGTTLPLLRHRRWKRSAVGWFVFSTIAATSVGIIPTSLASATSSALEFNSPSGLAFGGGHLWVTIEAGNFVSEINPSSGSWITTLRSSNYGFNRPTAITRSGADLFVTNAVGSVSEIRADNGALVRVISVRSSASSTRWRSRRPGARSWC